MMYVVSRFNHRMGWLNDYADELVLYDRSDEPAKGSIVVPNIGTDIYDKLTFIIDNYFYLPDVAVFTKANLFDYIKPREFEKVCNNTTFTPLLSQEHHTYGDICFYKDGMYYEKNNYWYLNEHPCKDERSKDTLIRYLAYLTHTDPNKEYNAFAPGSNYILTRENILKHELESYKYLRDFLEWAIYPGEAQILERNLYYLWQ